MSDEFDENEPSALDHIFNAFGHLFRAKQQKDAQRAEQPKRRSRKIKTAAFDEAPASLPAEPKACCTAKR
jgi:hypothetical protein